MDREGEREREREKVCVYAGNAYSGPPWAANPIHPPHLAYARLNDKTSIHDAT